MLELTADQLQQVDGGTAIWGEVAAVIHEGGVAGLAIGGAFFVGVAIGMAINDGFSRAFGRSIGFAFHEAMN